MNRAQRRAARKAGGRRKPTIGLALIVRDEERDLPNLLASVTGAFDQVALVDTGSVDTTVQVFEDWAGRTRQPHVIGHYTWHDDFAAARAYAHSLLTTDWECWADADDVIHGAQHLRKIAALAPLAVTCLLFDYVADALGPPEGFTCPEDCQCTDDYSCDRRSAGIRERLVRRGCCEWRNPVHEQLIDVTGGAMQVVPPSYVYWAHRRQDAEDYGASVARDQRIFDAWAAREPDSPALAAIGHRTGGTGRGAKLGGGDVFAVRRLGSS